VVTAALALIGYLSVGVAVAFLLGALCRYGDGPLEPEPAVDWDEHLDVWPSGDDLITADMPVDEWPQERIDAEVRRLEAWL